MRKVLPDKLESGRLRHGPYGSNSSDGQWGAFKIMGPCGRELVIMSAGASCDSGDWEHVSVSLSSRPPNWQEMCFVKSLFWEDDECVVQFHPPKADYINIHEHCLHLWRHVSLTFPMPPSILVGPKADVRD